jgi:predicted anti-sigma-YlaC factor YlaD
VKRLSRERCQRARRLISLALDGEIDSLRDHELRRHLIRCPECRALAGEYEWITDILRRSERARPERPIQMPSRMPSRLRLRAALLAAAAVGLVAVGGLSGSSGQKSSKTPTAVFLGTSFPTSYDPSRPVRIEHRA